jgi:hypothetical protein
MIRNLVILDDQGNDIVNANFGECHSLGTDPNLIGSFVSAVYSFSQSIIGQEIKNIKFDNLNFMILSKDSLVYMISVDDSEVIANRNKLKRISELFVERYGREFVHRESHPKHDFDRFVDVLHDLDITQKNCGGRPSCDDCPDHSTLPLDKIAQTIQGESP